MTSESTKKYVEEKIKQRLREFDFEVRSKTHPKECSCYETGIPCHSDIPKEELNCFYCICPEYDNDSEVGGCNLDNPLGKGKWYYDKNLPQGKIWDCSDCNWPHRKENVKAYFRRAFEPTKKHEFEKV